MLTRTVMSFMLYDHSDVLYESAYCVCFVGICTGL